MNTVSDLKVYHRLKNIFFVNLFLARAALIIFSYSGLSLTLQNFLRINRSRYFSMTIRQFPKGLPLPEIFLNFFKL
jgi:hypothetical protein